MKFDKIIGGLKFQWLFLTALGLLIISLFHKLGMQPLYQEEPRRALIALEMLFNNNFIVPTEFGEFYYKKPPVWNWFIVLGYGIFGQNEFAVRFFSPFFLLVTGLMVYWFSRKYIGKQHAQLASLYYLVSVDLFFYFSTLGEIDILYSAIVFAGFLSVFHFYQTKQYFLLFIITYLFTALGFLTKAFPSIIFTGVTLVVFFIYNKDFKRLFSLAHFTGIAVFVLIVGVYYLLYNQHNNSLYFIELLWSRSSKRTLMEEESTNLFKHIFVFPADMLKNLLPASFLFIFAFSKSARKKAWNNQFIRFSILIFLANLAVYVISPGSRQRYIYMLYTFPVIIAVFLFVESYLKLNWARKIYKWFGVIVMTGILAASLILPFSADFKGAPGLLTMGIIAAAASLLIIVAYFKSSTMNQSVFLIITIVLLKFMFNFSIYHQRDTNSSAQVNRDNAYKIIELTGGEMPFMYDEKECSRITVFYLEKELQKPINFSKSIDSGSFYIIADYYLPIKQPYETLLEFNDNKSIFYKLIRVK
jgi:4-amino-4-deoxy-L-arabinose transferase-like glycosyltransferase